jgi:Mrp family chromosome partitioning ATPase
MNPKSPGSLANPAISARDIYYVFFRHKWLIGTLVTIGVVATMVLRHYYPIYYSSEARVLVKYVVDTNPLTAEGADAHVTSLNTGDTILNAEQEMLTSRDVCLEVARVVGASRILGPGNGTNDSDAAAVIQSGLAPSRDRNSDVIHIYFSSLDRDLVQPVLSQVISAYEAKHEEVRRPKSAEKLTEGIDTLKGKVTDAESRLKDAEKKAGIIELEDSKKNVAMSIEKTEEQLNDLDIELKQESLILSDIRKGLPPELLVHATNALTTTNPPPEVPPEVAQEYKDANGILATLRSKELDFLSWTTTNHPGLQSVEIEIANTKAKCKQLVDKYPGLIAIKSAGGPSDDPLAAYSKESQKAGLLAIKYSGLTNQLAHAKAKQEQILAEEESILDAKHESEGYRANLDFWRKRAAEADLSGIIGPGNSNSVIIEAPTPPVADLLKLKKMCASIFFGSLFLALALPFVIEFYLDQSLKRPADIQNRLGIPFFVSMPKLSAKAQRAALKYEKKVPLLPASTGEAPPPDPAQPASAAAQAPAPSTNGHVAPWEQRHALRPFFETLRDRLMTYFEVINLTHKPKLVAVTSCGEGAGVTTTAAGLASALSETGEGNVLLVNMNVQDGEAHHFYRGKLTCGLEEALEREKRNAACIQDNLFLAKDLNVNENLPRVLPKRFSHLVPKMRASDYDYIIFDMPPMSQISITPRLARYMDMVLLVIESEKTDRDAAKRATNLLLESKTNVGVVLNKARTHLPRRLQQDI